MKWKHRHIVSAVFFLCGLLGFVVARNESPDLLRVEEDNSIFLTFHTALDRISIREGEHTDDRVARLRIVIVSKKAESASGEPTDDDTGWKVEWNRLISDASVPTLLPGAYTFKVDAGCRKRIYLIANEEGLTDYTGNQSFRFNDNSQFIPDADGKAPVDDYVFALSYSESVYAYTPGSLPMSAMYEFSMPDKKDLTLINDRFVYEISAPLYLVRAAAKCTFSFKNEASSKKVTVTAYGIKNVIINRMYLLPHVNRNGAGRYWVVDNGGAVEELTDPESGIAWVDWMIDEARKEATESYQWLTDYEVPDPRAGDANTGDLVPGVHLELAANTTGTPAEGVVAPIYLPESKTLKSGADALKLQEYTVFIRTLESFPGGSSEGNQNRIKEYTATLPHLASLFRNTDARVSVVFHDNAITVDVIPYSEVELEPDFGLDPPDPPSQE